MTAINNFDNSEKCVQSFKMKLFFENSFTTAIHLSKWYIILDRFFNPFSDVVNYMND